MGFLITGVDPRVPESILSTTHNCILWIDFPGNNSKVRFVWDADHSVGTCLYFERPGFGKTNTQILSWTLGTLGTGGLHFRPNALFMHVSRSARNKSMSYDYKYAEHLNELRWNLLGCTLNKISVLRCCKLKDNTQCVCIMCLRISVVLRAERNGTRALVSFSRKKDYEKLG